MAANTPLIQPTTNTPFIMSSDSGDIRYQNNRVSLVLSAENLYVFDFVSKATRKEIHLNAIIGAKRRQVQKPTNYSWLDVFVYDFIKPSCLNCCSKVQKLRVRELVSFKVPATEAASVDDWVSNILAAMNNKPILKTEEGLILGPQNGFASGSARRFLIFVNPVSGKRTAVREYETKVKPMMLEAGAGRSNIAASIILFNQNNNTDVKLIITQYANHAREYVQSFDPTLYDAIITIGGDGMYYEVLNGIFSRADGLDVLKTLPLMPIPGGTGNGLVKSILHETDEDYSVVNATFAALRGTPAPMDISYVYTRTQSHYSFLLLGWGLVSDIDILSETMRCIGEPRIYIAAVYFILRKRQYRGRISIYTGHNDPDASPLTDLPAIDQPLVPSNQWTVLEGNFVLVWVVQTSHCTASMNSGPGVTMDDGQFTIYVIQDIGTISLAMLLLSFDNGGHHNHPLVKTYKTAAYRLEPLTDRGIFTLDGEVVEYGPIQGIMRPGLGRVLKVLK
jgi:sphingosine kinase